MAIATWVFRRRTVLPPPARAPRSRTEVLWEWSFVFAGPGPSPERRPCRAAWRPCGSVEASPSRRKAPVRLLVLLWVALPLGGLAGGTPGDAATPPPENDAPPVERLPLEEPLAPLVPQREPNEAERDQVHALALFSTGRALEQRDQQAQALRYYQRAFRYDPRSKTAARAVLMLADELGRADEFDRYLPRAIALEPDVVDPIDLVGLVDRTEDDRLRRQAMALLERVAVDRAAIAKKTPADVAIHWALAEDRLLAESHKEAAEHVAVVLDAAENPKRYGLAPRDAKQWFGPSEYRMFGEYMLRAGQLDRAEALFRQADQRLPNPAVLDYDLARVALARGKADEALKQVETCLARQPTDLGLGPCKLLADALAALGRKDELATRLGKLADGSPASAPAALFLAETYRAGGEPDRAVLLLEKLLARRPVAEAYRALFAIYAQKKEPEKLARLAEEVFQKAGSIELVEESIAAMPEDVATEFFKQADSLAPDARAELRLLHGQRLLAAQEYAEAADVLAQVDEATKATEPERALAAYCRAVALAMDERPDEALAASREAGKDARRLPLALAQQAWILFRAKRDEDAIRAYLDLIDRYEDDYATPGVRDVLREARLVLAGLRMAHGSPAQAQELLERVLDEFPDDVSALNDLGYLWADRGEHLERALAMVRQAVEAEPDVAAYRDSLGWALFRLGRLDEAAAELEKAAKADPDEGELLEHLGDVYQAMGRAEDARDAWRRAAEAYRKAKDADRAGALEKKSPAPKNPASADPNSGELPSRHSERSDGSPVPIETLRFAQNE